MEASHARSWPSDGRRRVVISRILPEIDDSRFPVKRALGETLRVRAHVFSDGHDRIEVRLRYRQQADPEWRELPMRELGNDEWQAEFRLEKLGFYDCQVIAWIDHFVTWLEGFHKKAGAGEEIGVELRIGADLLDAAALRAPEPDAKRLGEWAALLRNPSLPIGERGLVARNPALTELARSFPDRRLESMSPFARRILVDPPRALFSSWYELFPRSWAAEPGRHGTFADCLRLLPEIAALGFDVLYLPPIHPIGSHFRKGKNNSVVSGPDDVGSPWAIGAKEGGHKAIHPALGGWEDFHRLQAQAKEFGLEIALDIALQCSPDHPYVREHPGWFRWRPDGSVQYAENPPKKYQDIIPFDFECIEWRSLWEELRSIFLFWIDRGIRIFRVDNPHTKPMAFWEWLIADLKAAHPEIVLLSEAFTRPKLLYHLAKCGFSQGYTYFTWRMTPAELREYLTELTSPPVREFFRPSFWPNTPDILPAHLQEGDRSTFLQRLILAATLSSNYGIYGPAFELCIREALVPGKEEYLDSEKYQLRHWDWHAPGHIKAEIARINHIRKTHRALQETNNLRFCDIDNPQLLAYAKASSDHGDVILAVVNMDAHPQSGWVRFPAEEFGIDSRKPFQVNDLLTDTSYTWHDGSNYVRLDPAVWPAHLFWVTQYAPD